MAARLLLACLLPLALGVSPPTPEALDAAAAEAAGEAEVRLPDPDDPRNDEDDVELTEVLEHQGEGPPAASEGEAALIGEGAAWDQWGNYNMCCRCKDDALAFSPSGRCDTYTKRGGIQRRAHIPACHHEGYDLKWCASQCNTLVPAIGYG